MSCDDQTTIENDQIRLTVPGSADCLWQITVRETGQKLALAAPVFEVDGQRHSCALASVAPGAPVQLRPDLIEYHLVGTVREDPGLTLELVLRVAAASPVVRFRYVLRASGERRLTKQSGDAATVYLGASFAGLPEVTEVRVAEFVELAHSYCLAERPVRAGDFLDEATLMGPVLAGTDDRTAVLLAYEHGSQVPDAFLQYRLGADRAVQLAAVKGNFASGRQLAPSHPFTTLWLHAAVIHGDLESMAASYRAFVLRDMEPSRASRAPLIFYNSWALQERNKWWHGGQYLQPMEESRMLAEIDAAHALGIDVFVLDTGWYEKTGDWTVNRRRFPTLLEAVKVRLDSYGMRLGLWFGPTSAALTSHALRDHRDCMMTWHGQPYAPQPIWETEVSARMCLVSRYADAFADELIRLAGETGVSYFKWDAIDQYGCDDPGHTHGGPEHTPEERSQCYAFGLVGAMTHVVERLRQACPDAIVDFDVTEAHRAVGLAFLSAGKYFLINNGPYFQNYDVPIDPARQNTNLFFRPGLARTWICRYPLGFDRWLPSILFLTHYLPDDAAMDQLTGVASLILGQNGIWGDLTTVPPAGVRALAEVLTRYKAVRDDITAAPPIRRGPLGGSPEVHEKVNPATGRGACVLFATAPGCYHYRTERAVDGAWWASEGLAVSRSLDGRARLDWDTTRAGAAIVLFGAGPPCKRVAFPLGRQRALTLRLPYSAEPVHPDGCPAEGPAAEAPV